MPETRAEDPRILSREQFDHMVLGDADTFLRCRDLVWNHDLSQRERIATLEADNRRLRESALSAVQCLREIEAETRTAGYDFGMPKVCAKAGAMATELVFALQPSPVQSGATNTEQDSLFTIERDGKQIDPLDCGDFTAFVSLSAAKEWADNRRLFEHIIAISTTAGNRSLSEMELRVKIIGVCHSALQPSPVQPAGPHGKDGNGEHLRGQMTDAEIIRTIAEKVMGWTLMGSFPLGDGGETSQFRLPSGATRWLNYPLDGDVDRFDPLTSISDAFMVVEKMRERRVLLTLHDCRDHFLASFNALHSSRVVPFSQDPNPARAICLAAIAALEER